jgi:hypothetical protein
VSDIRRERRMPGLVLGSVWAPPVFGEFLKEPSLIKKSARMIRVEHPGMPCVVTPGAGHKWGMETPDLFTAMIRAWVEHAPLTVELHQCPELAV